MKWLITGGCGFIGRNLIRNLTEKAGNYIRIIDNLSVGTRNDLSKVCQFVEIAPEVLVNDALKMYGQPRNSTSVVLIPGDILDENLALAAATGMDIIVHLAANTGVAPSVEDPRADCLTNIIGTFNYLEAARKQNVRRFVFASSGAPVGECEPPIHEEIAPHPVSPYGASKLAGEGYCSAYHKTFGIETVALRFGNVYGPLSTRKDSVIAKFIKRAMEGKPIEIYGNGKQTRDFIFIEDLISAIMHAAQKAGIGGETFQIATQSETTILEIKDKLMEIFSFHNLSNPDVRFSQTRQGDVKRNFSNTEKAAIRLGWTSKTSLEIGLAKTVSWFLSLKE